MTHEHRPHCCLTILLTGLAIALEKATLRFGDGSSVRSFLFSYKAKGVENHISRLLELFSMFDGYEYEWIWPRINEYCEHPLVEREKFLAQVEEYFDIHRTDLIEDGFEYSVLSVGGRRLGEQVYEESRLFFMNLSSFLYREWLRGGLSQSYNIVFFRLEE